MVFLRADLRHGRGRVMHDFHVLVQTGLGEQIGVLAGILVKNGQHQITTLPWIVHDQRLFQRHGVGVIRTVVHKNVALFLILDLQFLQTGGNPSSPHEARHANA